MTRSTAAGDQGLAPARPVRSAAVAISLACGLGSAAIVVAAVVTFAAKDWIGLAEALTRAPALALAGLLAWRRPDNRFSWLFLGFATLVCIHSAGGSYLAHPLTGGTTGLVIAKYTNDLAFPLVGITLPLIAVFFPDGELPSRRWRPVLWCAAYLAIVVPIGGLFAPEPLTNDPGSPRNPLGSEAIFGLLFPLILLTNFLMVPLVLAAPAALIVRWRRSQGEQRQQLKWVIFTALVAIGLLLVVFLLDQRGGLFDLWVSFVTVAFPASMALAILRYRLYDIDRLINRTLVYGLLTALLGGVYAAAILILGQLFGGVAGNRRSWAVAGATLAAAALFQPARRRIQQGVDRRFNRSKYNTAQTIEAFSARLRDEVDLDTLSAELLVVVDQTMQPTTASLWLRPSKAP